jgi:hypothetical protein
VVATFSASANSIGDVSVNLWRGKGICQMRLSVSQLMEVAALLWEGSYLAKKKNCSGDSGSRGDGALGERTGGGG